MSKILLTYFFVILSLDGFFNYFMMDSTIFYYLLFCIPLLFLNKIKMEEILKDNLFKLFSIMSIFIFISGIVNKDLRTMMNGPIFLIFFLSFYFIIPKLKIKNLIKQLLIAIILSQLCILFLSFLYQSTIAIPYKGVFLNPNTFAIKVLPLFILSLSLFANYLHEKYFFINNIFYLEILFSILLVLLSFSILIISRSRTVITTTLISFILIFILNFIYSIKYFRFGNFIVSNVLVMPSILLFAVMINQFFIPIKDLFYKIILGKFTAKSSDLLSGRAFAWRITLNEISFFGHGQYYFVDRVGLGAHSTYINQLGVHGLIVLIIFIIIFMIFFIKSVRVIFNKKNVSYKFLPFLYLVSFILVSLGEDIIFNELMIVATILSGSIKNGKLLNYE